MTISESKKSSVVLRWIVFVPGALAGGLLAGLAMFYFLDLFSSLWGNDLYVRLIVLAAFYVAGNSAVFLGAMIAPLEVKQIPAYIVGGVLILLALGYRLFVAELPLLEVLCLLAGVIVATRNARFGKLTVSSA